MRQNYFSTQSTNEVVDQLNTLVTELESRQKTAAGSLAFSPTQLLSLNNTASRLQQLLAEDGAGTKESPVNSMLMAQTILEHDKDTASTTKKPA